MLQVSVVWDHSTPQRLHTACNLVSSLQLAEQGRIRFHVTFKVVMTSTLERLLYCVYWCIPLRGTVNFATQLSHQKWDWCQYIVNCKLMSTIWKFLQQESVIFQTNFCCDIIKTKEFLSSYINLEVQPKMYMLLAVLFCAKDLFLLLVAMWVP